MVRLHTEDKLQQGMLLLSPEQSHYLSHVMRLREGAAIHVFNADSGEWQATLKENKRKQWLIQVTHCIRLPEAISPLHLVFVPLKNDAMHMVIEKATELGATDLWPVMTERAIGRINMERIQAQATMAAQQCERLDVPVLHPIERLDQFLSHWAEKLAFADEGRGEQTISLKSAISQGIHAFLIGPEGGFTPQEREMIYRQKNVLGISLGPRILRAETAAITCLAGYGLFMNEGR